MRNSSDSISVLHVDDDPEFAAMVSEMLEREDERLEVDTVTDPRDAMAPLETERYDCVVSDYQMPAYDGIEFLERVRAQFPELPFILFTGKGSEEVASEAISAGVTDYLQKSSGTSQYAVLSHRIRNAVETYRSRRALEDTEEKLSQLAERTDDILFMYDGDWSELLFINSAFEDIWGFSADRLEAHPRAFLEAIHPEDREAARESMERLSDGEPEDIEYRIRRPDGEERWVRGETKPVVEDGEVTRIVGYVRDVTQRKEAQRAFDTLVDNLPGVVYRCRNERGWPMETVRGDSEGLWGYAADQLEGEEVSYGADIIHPEDRDRVWEAVQAGVESEEPFTMTYRVRTADGTEKWVREKGRIVRSIEDDAEYLEGFVFDVTERTRAEERFEGYIENAPYGVFVADEAGDYLEVNETACEITGYDADELLDMNVGDLAESDAQGPEPPAFDRLKESGTVRRELPFERKDGSRGYWDVYAVSVGPDRFLAFVDDITERRERERELHQYERMVNTMEAAACIYDAEGRFEIVNEYLAAWYGETPSDLRGRESALVPKIQDQYETDVFAELLAGDRESVEGVLEGEFSGRGHAVVEYRLSPLAEDGTGEGVVGVARDITTQRQRERQLEEQNEQITAIHEVAMDIGTCESRDEVYETVVRAAESILEYDIAIVDEAEGEYLVPRAVSSAVSPDQYYDTTPIDAQDNLAAKAYRTGESSVIEDIRDLDFAPADPEFRSALTIPIAEVGIFQAVSTEPGMFDDVDRERSELLVSHATAQLNQIAGKQRLRERTEQLRRKNERLDEFASLVSHDLRNPLTVAQGRLELAMEECDSEHLDALGDALRQSHGRVDDLLALARVGDSVSEAESVALASVVEGAWAGTATSEATLDADLDRSVRADPDRLRQVFENVFRNAVEHGGEDVTVAVGQLEDGFYVEDDGPGIPEDARGAVFEAGYSTAEEGTGFGLNIVEEIVEGHGWEITVTTGEMGGARFEIRNVESAE